MNEHMKHIKLHDHMVSKQLIFVLNDNQDILNFHDFYLNLHIDFYLFKIIVYLFDSPECDIFNYVVQINSRIVCTLRYYSIYIR